MKKRDEIIGYDDNGEPMYALGWDGVATIALSVVIAVCTLLLAGLVCWAIWQIWTGGVS